MAGENQQQNAPLQEDLLEKLLAGAAEAAAKKALEEKLSKETVTRNEVSAALAQLQAQFQEQLATAPQAQGEQVQKGAGRKGTVTETPEDPREADPANFVLRKAQKGEPLDDTDKAIIWGMTFKALTQGMSTLDTQEN